MSWDEERTARLRELWMSGLSASECAAQLGGVSRSAVIGKVHRLGMFRTRSTHRTQAIKAGMQRRSLSGIKPSRRNMVDKGKLTVKAILAAIDKAEPPASEATDVAKTGLEPLVKHVLDLESNHCRWIEGQPTTGWCGRQVAGPGVSWCATHARRVFDLREPTRRRVFDPVVAPATVKEDA